MSRMWRRVGMPIPSLALVLAVNLLFLIVSAGNVRAQEPVQTATEFFKRSVSLAESAADFVAPAHREAYRSLLHDALDSWEKAHPDMPYDIWVKGFDFSGLSFQEIASGSDDAEVRVSGSYSVQAGGVLKTRDVDITIHLVNTAQGWLVARP